jgi:glycosyltransferase involved in cell wall biosynthesis
MGDGQASSGRDPGWRPDVLRDLLNRFLSRSKIRLTRIDDGRNMRNLEAAPIPVPTPGPLSAPASPPLPDILAGPVVDIVVPVFDEERALEPGVRRLHSYLTSDFPFSWRVTIVDNASTDGTWVQAQRLAHELAGVQAIHLDRKGRGLALRSAWSASDADVVAYMDVDLSTDLDALLPLVAPLVSGHSDVAIGSRLAPGSHVARHPKRELISRSYNLILRTVLATRVRDAQCGFKAVRGSVARRLLPAIEDDGWFFDTELLLLAERNGLRIHEVPVDWVDDTDSRVRVVSTAIGDLRGAARMAVGFARGRGRIDLGSDRRAPLVNDFGRRFVAFSLIGAASTAVSLVLYLSTHQAIGPIAANVVAVTATFVANAWANARYTERRSRPRWARSLALYAGSIAATSAALAVVDAWTTSSSAQIVVLVATWSLAAGARFLAIASSR